MTHKQLDAAVADIKEALGEHMVGDVIREAEKSDGQIGFATDELDAGPDVRGKWCDTFEEILDRHGLGDLVFMPFPVQGRLVYVIAGLQRIKDEEG
jgi:hypothetical protein